MSRHLVSRSSRRLHLRRALIAALAGGLVAGATGAVAAPVRSEELGPDAFELALQWTLASLTPDAAPATAAAAPGPAMAPAVRHPVVQPAAVPDPGAYALMGLLLLGAGVAAQRFGRIRGAGRRASKMTPAA